VKVIVEVQLPPGAILPQALATNPVVVAKAGVAATVPLLVTVNEAVLDAPGPTSGSARLVVETANEATPPVPVKDSLWVGALLVI
jgi:hypothetical protein